jgi:hypothetical protein
MLDFLLLVLILMLIHDSLSYIVSPANLSPCRRDAAPPANLPL